jgi:hypothetical protein
MTIGFFGWLVFALVFFGVYSLYQVAFQAGQARTVHALIALVFIILAWALTRFA